MHQIQQTDKEIGNAQKQQCIIAHLTPNVPDQEERAPGYSDGK